jgi:hypothetical protein
MPLRSALVRAGLATGLALAALLLRVGSVHAAPVHAQPAPALAASKHKPSAVELAAGACRLERWAAAVDLMRVVERQERSAADWLCLARAELHTGQWVAALDSYDELLESEAPAVKERMQSKARLLQDGEARQLGQIERQELEQRLAWIEIVPSTTLPASVKLSLDGEVIARSRIGVRFPVQPGPHAFAVEVRGVARELAHWRLAEGEQRKVNLSLPAAEAERAVATHGVLQRQPTLPAPRQRAAEPDELARWARGSLYAGGFAASAGVVLLGASNAGGGFDEGVFRLGIGSLALGGMALFTGAGLYLTRALLGSSPNETPLEPPRRPAVEPWISSNGAGVSGTF